MGDRELVTVVDAGKRCQVGRIIVDAGGRRCGRAAGNRRFVGVQVRTEFDVGGRCGRRQDRVDIKNLKVGDCRAV